MNIVPFKAEHVLGLKLQQEQARAHGVLNLEYGRALELAGGGFTALVDGHPIACSGIVEQWAHRGLAWALIGEDAGPHFVSIIRGIRRALAIAHYHRVEMQVQANFPQAIRMAELLGFEVESLMRLFMPDGSDAFMYVRLNPDLHGGRAVKPDGSGLLCAA